MRLLCFFIAISAGGTTAYSQYVADAPINATPYLYSIPPIAWGGAGPPAFYWANPLSPRYPVLIFGPPGQLGFFQVRDGRTSQAFMKNLEKWCATNGMTVKTIKRQGEGFRVDVDKNSSGPSGPQESLAKKFPKKEVAKVVPKTDGRQDGGEKAIDGLAAELTDVEARIAVIQERLEKDPDITPLVESLAKLDAKRKGLLAKIDVEWKAFIGPTAPMDEPETDPAILASREKLKQGLKKPDEQK